MKNTIMLLMVAAIVGGSFAWPSTANACSCIEPPGIEEELSRSDAVFSGKAIKVDEEQALFSASTRSIVFQVAQVWKGTRQSQVKITTGQGGGDCGYDFMVGQEYLVYAVKSDMYGADELITIICDRTAVLSQAQGDLAVLGEGQEPTEEVDLLSRNGWLLPFAGFIVLAVIAIFVYRKRKKINQSG